MYIIGTPIGNLEDITLRAFRILKTVDFVAAEDTRHSGQLLHHFGIKKPMISYFEHNKKARTGRVLDLLREGKSVGLVSDAGMPGISDPGTDLIQECIDQELPICIIPGPTALITALVASGLGTEGFAFGGFIPRENKKRKQWLIEYGEFKKTVIFYESPHRVIATLGLLREMWGDRKCCVSRELTKKFEEHCRGSLTEVINELEKRELIKGEIVVTVAGLDTIEDKTQKWPEADILALSQVYKSQGLSKKQVSQLIATQTGQPRRDIYNLLINYQQHEI